MNSNHNTIMYGIVWCLKDRSGATWEQTTWYETKDQRDRYYREARKKNRRCRKVMRKITRV